MILVTLDRDRTLIKNNDFFGKNKTWKNELVLNEEVVKFLSAIDNKYQTTKLVISNQSGVARGFFKEQRVIEINNCLESLLKFRGIIIDNWQFCPYVDEHYAKRHPELDFMKRYIQKVTKRKPKIDMVTNALSQINKHLSEFDKIMVLGDRSEDEGLAKNLNGFFIDVKKQTYNSLYTLLASQLKI